MSATCATRSQREATGSCAWCGSFFCAECATTRLESAPYCVACDAREPESEPASRTARFWANLVDLSVIPLPFATGAIIDWGLWRLGHLHKPIGGLVSIACGGAVSLALLVLQVRLALNGQSIGKRSRGIRVVRTDGNRASLFRILARNLVTVIAFAPLPFAFLLIFIDALMIFGNERRCLHDVMVGTKVVKVPDERSASR